MEHARNEEFAQTRTSTLSMAAAVRLAKAEIAGVSAAPVDAVARCDREGEGGWLVALDLIESPARMGENDLLARYELRLDKGGSVTSIERTARYRREDRNAP